MSTPNFVYEIRGQANFFALLSFLSITAIFFLDGDSAWVRYPFYLASALVFCYGVIEILSLRFHKIGLGFEWSETLVGVVNLVGAYTLLRKEWGDLYEVYEGKLSISLSELAQATPTLALAIAMLVLGIGTLCRTLPYGFSEIRRYLEKKFS